jgi:hypothetical protein
MPTPSNRYKHTTQETEFSLSDLALKFIDKADRSLSKTKRGLGKAKNGVKFYQKHPTAFKVGGALALAGLVVYLNRKDAKPESLSTASVTS